MEGVYIMRLGEERKDRGGLNRGIMRRKREWRRSKSGDQMKEGRVEGV